MEINLKNLADVAQKIGALPEYVQGGGGNVSVKLDNSVMAVKASGFCLKDLRSDSGFVNVNYQTLRQFYELSDDSKDLTTLIAENDAVVHSSIILNDDSPNTLRPSIETGFHAILGNCVIHSHSVYANVLTCAVEGKDVAHSLFPDAVFVPYRTPGIALTIAVKEACGNKNPKIFFLENHGLIVVGETAREAATLHEQVNTVIREKFLLTEAYPLVSIGNGEEESLVSTSPYVHDWIKKNPEQTRALSETILFPDQVVYGEQIAFNPETPAPISIDLDTGIISYKTSHGEALAFEETFVAWSYIRDTVALCGLTLRTLSIDEGRIITGLESEKYRKSII